MRTNHWQLALCVVAAVTLSTSRAWSGSLTETLKQPILTQEEATAQYNRFVLQRIPKLKVASSAEEWQETAAELRQRILDEVVFRGVPDSWRQPQAAVVWLETIGSGSGYRIRKLRVEALPGLWIPALLYEPDEIIGRTPAVLCVNGHERTGKSVDYKQQRCINLAKRGMLALNLEWIGMGQLRAPGYSHNNLGKLDLCGRSGLSVFFLAMSRGLDVLLDHPHTDPERVAVTGLSGGGWQTIILSSLDTRVRLCVPVAGHSSLVQRVRNRNSIGDLEQNPNDLISIGDYVHLNALMTPRPTLSIYNSRDNCCFVANTVKDNTFDPVVAFYEQAGVPGAWEYYENDDPGTHNYEQDNREQLYRFLNAHFFGSKGSNEEIGSEKEVLSHAALNVDMPEHNATFHSLAADTATELPKTLGGTTDEQRAKLRDVLRFRPLIAITSTADVGERIGERQLSPLRLQIGREWTLPAVVIEGSSPTKTILLIADSGLGSQADRIAALSKDARVLAVDPVLMGQASPAGDIGQNAMLMATVGERALGVQVAQLLAVARSARKDFNGPLELHSDGPRTGLIAAAVAALDGGKDLNAVHSKNACESLKSFLEPSAAYNQTPEAYCFGLLEWFDIPQLRELAGGS